MWRSRIFWRLFGTYGVLWLVSIGVLGVVIVGRVEGLFVERLEDRPVDVREQLVYLRWLVWSAVAGTALAGLALSFWLSRRMALPLNELTKAARRIAGGAYGHQVQIEVGAGDEMGALARAFNRMSDRLAVQFTQMEEDREQLRAILSGMIEGVVALDAEERILFANERAAELLEFEGEQAIGRKLWQVVRRRALQEMVRKVLAGSQVSHEELTWNGPGSSNLTVHAARLPGEPARGAVLVLHDTSELRRLERIRQEFVANVSHELKTPLSIIKVCVETLIDGAVEDVQHRGAFLDKVAVQADRLHALILDLLSLARIESGAEAFEFQEVALEPIVQACLERHRARASAKEQELVSSGAAELRSSQNSGVAELRSSGVVNSGVAESGSDGAAQALTTPLLRNSAAPLIPTPLLRYSATPLLAAWGDEEAVSQILDNLVDNAVKYTPAGGKIQVGWWEENGQVCLEVADNGIGIPEHDLPRIFERFYRVDRARSRELGGTGLGLSIVKHLVQAMHGSVEAQSRVGAGTRFVVRLPRAPAA